MFVYFLRFMCWLGFTTLRDAEVRRFVLITRLKKLAPIIKETIQELDANVRADKLLINNTEVYEQLRLAIAILETHRLQTKITT